MAHILDSSPAPPGCLAYLQWDNLHRMSHGSGQIVSCPGGSERLGALGRALRPGMILRPDNGHQRIPGWMAWGCPSLAHLVQIPKLCVVFLKQPCLCPLCFPRMA